MTLITEARRVVATQRNKDLDILYQSRSFDNLKFVMADSSKVKTMRTRVTSPKSVIVLTDTDTENELSDADTDFYHSEDDE